MQDRQQIRTSVVEAHRRVLAAVDGFDARLIETDPAVGSWSPRDTVGHLADWERETLSAAAHILGGPKPRYHPIKDRQGFNNMQVALRGTDPWEVTRSDFVAAEEQMLVFIDSLEAGQLDAIGPYPRGEIGPLYRLLSQFVQHLDEHATQLETWRLRRTGIHRT